MQVNPQQFSEEQAEEIVSRGPAGMQFAEKDYESGFNIKTVHHLRYDKEDKPIATFKSRSAAFKHLKDNPHLHADYKMGLLRYGYDVSEE